MYPDVVFLGMTFYEIWILVGIFAVMLLFRAYADKQKMQAKFQNLVLVNIVFTLICGYLSAVVFQAFYNFLATGSFEVTQSTGATFYGGLIGGTAAFIIVYFTVGRLLCGNEPKDRFYEMLDLGGAAIPLAHGFGRLGCLFMGCCHGGRTDAWYGIYSKNLGYKIVPIPLYESIFLFALSALLITLIWKRGKYSHIMPAYLGIYGIWRFIIEFFRADYRGASPIPFLSPSQFTSVILIITAIILYIVMEKLHARKKESAQQSH